MTNDKNKITTAEEFMLKEHDLDNSKVTNIEDLTKNLAKKEIGGLVTDVAISAIPFGAGIAALGGVPVLKDTATEYVDDFFNSKEGSKIFNGISKGWGGLSEIFAEMLGKIFGSENSGKITSIEKKDIKEIAQNLVVGAGLVDEKAFKQNTDENSDIYKNAEIKSMLIASAINNGLKESHKSLTGAIEEQTAGISSKFSNFVFSEETTPELKNAMNVSENIFNNIYKTTVGLLKNDYRQAYEEKGEIPKEELLKISEIAANTASQYSGIKINAVTNKNGEVTDIEYEPIKTDNEYTGIFKFIHDNETNSDGINVVITSEAKALSTEFRTSLNQGKKENISKRQDLIIDAMGEAAYNLGNPKNKDNIESRHDDVDSLMENMNIPDSNRNDVITALNTTINNIKSTDGNKIAGVSIMENFEKNSINIASDVNFADIALQAFNSSIEREKIQQENIISK